ncbi:MAG: DUF6519 domain-containing protein [Candidatus Polarisedimenticolia bacterium]
MAGDYSRKTFDRRRNYDGVLMQQGRVQLDADWNEQLDIHLHRTRTEAIDVIGRCGVPKDRKDSFQVGVIATAGGQDISISPGRIYVDGLLCELDVPTTYSTQPYLPNPEFASLSSPPASPPGGPLPLSLDDGHYLVFLDVWQRERTALDDDRLREVALGGPDTAARLQTVFQIRLLRVPEPSPPGGFDCRSSLPEFDALVAGTTGGLAARTQPPAAGDNPCLLPPTAGYTLLENQLYRVEVHQGGSRSQTTFKWSRENASVETRIEKIDGSVLTVESLGKDGVLGFVGQPWVEIVDDESDLKIAPHSLAQIDSINQATREITLKTSAGAMAGRSGLKLRRWDQTGGSATAAGISAVLSSWIDLEGGIQVQFSDGSYHAGDHWLIPARTVTGDIEWPPFDALTPPFVQPPRGIQHHFCKLARIEVVGGAILLRDDCREAFPPLTGICAEDVCFDDRNCRMDGVETVQEAIDRLCTARDLRFHNKHLHGWGIVCGLQVECGPNDLGQARRHVTVRSGYAIDCEGNDIIVDQDERIDLVALANGTLSSPPASPVASPPSLGDMEVSLVLDSTGSGPSRYRLERYSPPQNPTQSLLKGTLLLDFFNDCVMSLVDFVVDEFTPDPGEEKLPVGPTAKRLITFLNLLVELWDTLNGPFVYLSGEKGQAGKNLEDTILRQFYEALRARLQSHTFCAMFEGARPFPEYPYAGLKIATIFGKGSHTRFRVAPNGTTGYSMGTNNKLNVYDLKKGEIVAELEPPFPGGAIIQDVAFSANGKELYAVATHGNRDSYFAVASVKGFIHAFRSPTTICDVLLVTLATRKAAPGVVYAIGRGKGLYEIDPQNAVNTAANTPKDGFNAAGHLVVNEELGQAFATANTAGSSSTQYDRVRRVNLSGTLSPVEFKTRAVVSGNTILAPGEDDIALAADGARLFVVSGLSTSAFNKQAVVFKAADTAADPKPLAIVGLGDTTSIRLADNPMTKHLMVTYEDSYQVRLINGANKLVPDFRQPVQLSPLSIAVAPGGRMVYVLNAVSSTVTSIPAERLSPKSQIDLQQLVDYRAGVLNAYADLFAGLIQYLKDCFCDHLLVNCPTCGPEDKIYLACISIKDGQVYKVCNFSLRKYVHSFPTWEYWLSAVPILPFLKKILGDLCCSVLPLAFGAYQAPQPKVAAAAAGAATGAAAAAGGSSPMMAGVGSVRMKSATLRRGLTIVQQADFAGAFRERVRKFTSAGELFQSFAEATLDTLLVPPVRAVGPTEIMGKDLDDARTKLTDAGVVVAEVEAFDPARGAANLIEYTAAPLRLDQGARVKLVIKDNRVVSYARASDASPDLSELRQELEVNRAEIAKAAPVIEDLRTRLDDGRSEAVQLRSEIDALRGELLKSRQAYEESLATRDAQITELRIGAAALKKQLDQLGR